MPLRPNWRPAGGHGETQHPGRAGATGEAPIENRRPDIVHSSLYLPRSVYEALRKIAYDERVKIHDLVMEGIGAALWRRGYPSIETLKAGKKR